MNVIQKFGSVVFPFQFEERSIWLAILEAWVSISFWSAIAAAIIQFIAISFFSQSISLLNVLTFGMIATCIVICSWGFAFDEIEENTVIVNLSWATVITLLVVELKMFNAGLLLGSSTYLAMAYLFLGLVWLVCFIFDRSEV